MRGRRLWWLVLPPTVAKYHLVKVLMDLLQMHRLGKARHKLNEEILFGAVPVDIVVIIPNL
jgi:hypothetical protein